MRDRWLPAALVVALIAAMSYALYADFQRLSPRAETQSAQKPKQESTSTNSQCAESQGLFDVTLADIANIILAGSTVALWVATRKLWRTTEGHADYLRTSANAATAANTANREFFAATERPWLSVSVEIASDLIWLQTGAFFDATFTIKNIGRSPARNIGLRFEVIQSVGRRYRGDLIPNLIKRVNTQRPGATIFPGETRRQNNGATLSYSEIEAGLISLGGPPDPRHLIPTIVACVRYEFPFEPGFHHTVIEVDVSRRGTGSGNIQILMADDTIVPRDQLIVTSRFMSGCDAT